MGSDQFQTERQKAQRDEGIGIMVWNRRRDGSFRGVKLQCWIAEANAAYFFSR